MYLSNLTLKDFGPYQDSRIEFGKHTLLIGPNGAGKSSILRAVVWALTGSCHMTTADGKGFDKLIRTGADDATVSIDLKPYGVIERSRGKRHTLTLGWIDGGRLSDNNIRLLDTLGMPAETVMAIFDPVPILERTVEQQRAALLRILRPATIEVPDSLIAEGIRTISGIEQIEMLIKDRKEGTLRDLNRDAKWLDDHPPESPGDKPRDVNIAEREKLYNELDQKHQELTHEANKISQSIGVFEERIRRAEQIGTLPTEEDVAKLAAAIAEAEQKRSKAQTAQIDAANKVETGRRRQAELIGEGNAKTARLQDITDRLAELSSKPPFECPADACPLLKQLAERADTERRSLESERQATTERRDGIEKEILAVDAKIVEHADAVVAANDEFKKHDAKLKQLTTLAQDAERFKAIAEEADAARKSLEDAKAKLAQNTEALGKCTSLRTKNGQAIERYREWQKASDAVNDWRQKVAAASAAIDKQKRIIADLELLRKSIIGDKSEQFLNIISEFLAPFGISNVQYELNTGFTCEGRGAEMLSDGQKAMMFEAAFRTAVATITKADIVVLDDLAPMTGEFRSTISDQLRKTGHQIIECVVADNTDSFSKIEGETVIKISEGTATTVVSPAV